MFELCELLDNSPSYSARTTSEAFTLCSNFNQSCFDYYVRCEPYDVSSASAEDSFDWGKAKEGFRDSFDVFFTIFACYVIVKMFNLIPKK